MKDRINLWCTAIALRMLARRRRRDDIPDGDLVVSAIWMRQELEKARKNAAKEHRPASTR
jgi:hypothetical protein